MGEIVRGQDVTVQLFNADQELVLSLNPTSFDRNLDSDEERQMRLGEREETPRQQLHGYSGSMSFEEEGPVLDELQDAMVTRFLNGERVATIDILESTYYPETGTEKNYLYPDAVFKINRSASGKNDATELSVEWTSGFRREI